MLGDRIEMASDAPPWGRVAWKDRQACQGSGNTMYGSLFATETNGANIRARSAVRASQTQRELDALDIDICRCEHYRQNPRTSAAWEQIMPQVVCDAARLKHDQAQRPPPQPLTQARTISSVLAAPDADRAGECSDQPRRSPCRQFGCQLA